MSKAIRMAKHIAVEKEIKSAWEKIKAETFKVFKGSDLFVGMEKTYTPKSDSEEPLPPVKKEAVTTVSERLTWTQKFMVPLLDYELTRDAGNMSAKADIKIGDNVIISQVPVTTLLSLEKRLKELREIYDSAPTLDLSREWKKSPQNPRFMQHGPVTTYRSKKVTKGVILAPATEKFPANVEKVVEDVQIGTFQETILSGALSPGDKAKYLNRIDQLIAAVQVAREEANEVMVTPTQMGNDLLKFIHAD